MYLHFIFHWREDRKVFPFQTPDLSLMKKIKVLYFPSLWPGSSIDQARGRTPSSNASSCISGTFPVETNWGNFTTPELKGFQSNISRFPYDFNLRSSMIDQPASYVRGSSQPSRNVESFLPDFTESMSQATCISISSPHSFDRDRFRSRSEGSLAIFWWSDGWIHIQINK